MYLWRDSSKKFRCIYGGIHIKSSQYLLGDSNEGRDSYKEFTCIYDWIRI